MKIRVRDTVVTVLLLMLLMTSVYQIYLSYTTHGWLAYDVVNQSSLSSDLITFVAVFMITYSYMSLVYKTGTTKIYKKMVTDGIVIDFDGEFVNIMKDDIRLQIPKETFENLLREKK